MRSTTTATLLYLLAPALVAATTYDLTKEYSGQTFFDGWIFYGNCELPAPIREHLTNPLPR